MAYVLCVPMRVVAAPVCVCGVCGDGLKPDAMYRFAGAKSESYCLIVLDICALNVVTVACRCDHNWSVWCCATKVSRFGLFSGSMSKYTVLQLYGQRLQCNIVFWMSNSSMCNVRNYAPIHRCTCRFNLFVCLWFSETVCLFVCLSFSLSVIRTGQYNL